MLGKSLLKLLAALTPDDVQEMKHAGLSNEVGELIDALDTLADSCHRARLVERGLWADVRGRLDELLAALGEDQGEYGTRL